MGAVTPGCSGAPTGSTVDAAHDTDAASASADAGNDAASLVDGGGTGVDAALVDDAASDIDAPFVQSDAGGSLLSCGGRGGHACADTEYCDYGGVACGAADGTGECRARPLACSTMHMTVCGCDGVAYTNECEAARAGTDITGTFSCLTP